jgi:SHAQKYF class myb-like DNA-binding protein
MADESAGRWSNEEHDRFLRGLDIYGKKWTKVAEVVGTRSTVQVRSHAQKYFQKMVKGGGGSSREHLVDTGGFGLPGMPGGGIPRPYRIRSQLDVDSLRRAMPVPPPLQPFVAAGSGDIASGLYSCALSSVVDATLFSFACFKPVHYYQNRAKLDFVSFGCAHSACARAAPFSRLLTIDARHVVSRGWRRYLSPEIVPTGQDTFQGPDTGPGGEKREGGGTGLSIGLGAGLKRSLRQSDTEEDPEDEDEEEEDHPAAAAAVAAENSPINGVLFSRPGADLPCSHPGGPRGLEDYDGASAGSREDVRNSVPEWYKRGRGVGNLLEQAESLDWLVRGKGGGSNRGIRGVYLLRWLCVYSFFPPSLSGCALRAFVSFGRYVAPQTDSGCDLSSSQAKLNAPVAVRPLAYDIATSSAASSPAPSSSSASSASSSAASAAVLSAASSPRAHPPPMRASGGRVNGRSGGGRGHGSNGTGSGGPGSAAGGGNAGRGNGNGSSRAGSSNSSSGGGHGGPRQRPSWRDDHADPLPPPALHHPAHLEMTFSTMEVREGIP